MRSLDSQSIRVSPWDGVSDAGREMNGDAVNFVFKSGPEETVCSVAGQEGSCFVCWKD